MKVLIFTANTGGGHRRTAMTIKKYFEESSPETHVSVVDAIKEVNVLVDKTVCGGYEFMAKKTPKLYGFIYHQTQKDGKDISKPLSMMASKRLLRAVNIFQPDVIISTHPFAGEMVSWQKRAGRIDCPVISVMTDYGPHKAYIAPDVDAFVVPAEECVEPMVSFGADRDKIYPYGIPIPPEFHPVSDDQRAVLSKELGLDNEKGVPIILLMAGSFGVESVLDVYDSLMTSKNKFELVVITGKNERLHKTFEKRLNQTDKKVHLIYFTDRVSNYMQCCDLIITKPGGLTVSEAINTDLPMAIYSAIPGQEEDNTKFLLGRGIATEIVDTANAKDYIDPLLEDPSKLQNMKKQAVKFDISNALENIEALAVTLSGKYDEKIESAINDVYGAYLDNSATTKVSFNAAAKAMEMMTRHFGNPSSVHEVGLVAERELEHARKLIADRLGADNNEIVFTSCGTESNNMAIICTVQSKKRYGNKIVTTAIEHSSVTACMDKLEESGYEIVRLQPDRKGHITEQQIFDAIDDKTILVSIMLVNNELGTILPVEAAAKAIKYSGSRALLHVDAVQAFCKLDFNVKRLGADLVSVSGHKVNAPKGVGALYISKNAKIPSRMLGGGQERNMRSGTQAMPAICAFGQAVSDYPKPSELLARMESLAAYCRARLSVIDGITFNSPIDALPYVVNFSTNKIKSETMINFLSTKGVYVSGGSACSGKKDSYVLKAIGAKKNEIESSIRASFSYETTEEDIDALVSGIKEGMEKLVPFTK